jgi:hypothetical protein
MKSLRFALLLLLTTLLSACGAETGDPASAKMRGLSPQQIARLSPWSRMPFSEVMRDKIKITEAMEYDEEKPIHPAIPHHKAMDFQVPQGTPLYCPFDGWAVASFHTYHIDSPTLGRIGYGLGRFVEIKDKVSGKFMLIAHLDTIEKANVKYLEPTFNTTSKEWDPTKVYISDADFEEIGKPIKRGDLLGTVGYTGLSRGYEETPDEVLNPAVQKTWDPAGPHAHVEHFEGRNSKFLKRNITDPFGQSSRSIAKDYIGILRMPVSGLADFIADKSRNNWPEFARN